MILNTLRPRQNGRHLPDAILKCIFFLNENVSISIKISLEFILKCPINNIPALVQILAWCRLGDKPLSEPMMIILLMHIYVTGPQWVKVKLNYVANNTSIKDHSTMLKAVQLMAQITHIHNDTYYFTFSRTLLFLVMNEWYINLPNHFWTCLSFLDIRYKNICFSFICLNRG